MYAFIKSGPLMRHWRATSLVLVLSAVANHALGDTACAEEVLPKHINAETIKAVRAGLDYLAATQGSDGAWGDEGGRAYPVAISSLAGMAFLAQGNTPTRGRHAPQIQATIDYLLKCSQPSGLLTGPGQDSGQPMHGHGFAMMFLASVYGMETKESTRHRIKEAVDNAVALTSKGQSGAGGWTYIPGAGDEGSVTVTQVQGLRAAHNAGFSVPRGTIEQAVQYIEKCSTPEGGIRYSLGSGGGARLAISAASVATLYNAGEFDAPVAERCLDYVWRSFKATDGWSKGGGHDYYCQLYASQGFYMAGDKYWDEYFPSTRDALLKNQDKGDGSWPGDYIGKAYGTSIALIILQLPYKYLPVFQR